MKMPSFVRLVVALERLADAADRAYPPDLKREKPRKLTLDDLSTYDAAADFEAEQEEERRREAGEDSANV